MPTLFLKADDIFTGDLRIDALNQGLYTYGSATYTLISVWPSRQAEITGCPDGHQQDKVMSAERSLMFRLRNLIFRSGSWYQGSIGEQEVKLPSRHQSRRTEEDPPLTRCSRTLLSYVAAVAPYKVLLHSMNSLFF
jgi:hypothetical protein